MDANPQIALAWEFLERTGENIFLTGRAGTGKTTFLRSLREASPKRMIVVAPTGVAAINAGGVTMHSFFQLPFGLHIPGMQRTVAGADPEIKRFNKTKIAIIRSLDLLVIDEISMVRADLLDSVDEVLRRFRDRSKPFGGVQLLMIGDLQQLAPVVKDDEWEIMRRYYRSPYFFDSHALGRSSYVSIELRHIYRQSDARFIDLLAAVRDDRIDQTVLEALNSRYIPDFDPPQSEGYITLTSHNAAARTINEQKMEQLPGREYCFTAEVQGQYPEYLYPVERELRLKQGAQVMFAKNDPSPAHRFVNGTIGTVTAIDQYRIEVLPAGADEPVDVEMAPWENSRYTIDEQTSSIVEQIEGVFIQYPLKAAWAITIHKSQGLTFDRAVIDAAESFSHGQVYVALSRCRTLEGMVLRSPLGRRAIINDSTVGRFTKGVEQNQPTPVQLDAFQRQYYRSLLLEMFDFSTLTSLCRSAAGLVGENLARLYPKLAERWQTASVSVKEEMLDVGLRFRMQLNRLFDQGHSQEEIELRTAKGAAYFMDKCTGLLMELLQQSAVSIDNKELKKRYNDLLANTARELSIKLSTLARAGDQFTVQGYLEAKSTAIARNETSPKEMLRAPKKEKAAKRAAKEAQTGDDGDIIDEALFETLRTWRSEVAAAQNVPAYVIATQRALIGVANNKPTDRSELSAIKGIGKVFIEKYSDQVLEIVDRHRQR